MLREAACALQFDPFTEAIAKVEKEIDEIIEGLMQAEQKTSRGLKKSADSTDDALRSKSSKKISKRNISES